MDNNVLTKRIVADVPTGTFCRFKSKLVAEDKSIKEFINEQVEKYVEDFKYQEKRVRVSPKTKRGSGRKAS